MAHCARTRRALPFLVAALVTILLIRPAAAQDDEIPFMGQEGKEARR